MIPFSPFHLRLPANGPTIEGTSDGQLLVWNQSSQGWTVAEAPESRTEFDFILESRADLVAVVAPVAGVFTLPGGSYFVKSSISLLDDERVEVVEATRFSGGGEGKRFIGNGTAPAYLFTVVDGSLLLDNFVLFTTGDMSGVQVLGGRLRVSNQNIISEADALDQQIGDVRIAQSVVSAGGVALHVEGGSLTAMSCQVSAVSECCLLDSGFSTGDVLLNGCSLTSSGPGGVATVQKTVGDIGLEIIGSRLIHLDASSGTCLRVESGSAVVAGGSIEGIGPQIQGIAAQGNFDLLQVNGTRFINVGTGVQWVSGTQQRVALIALDFDTSVGFGVSWPAAEIPFNGLLEIGITSQIDANTFIGHTEASAGVNRKACMANGLGAETPIVP